MNIINPQTGDLEKIIQPIDEKIIEELAKIAFKCNKETERYNLRDQLYSSKYNAKDLESKERSLEIFLQKTKIKNINGLKLILKIWAKLLVGFILHLIQKICMK